MDRIFLKVLGPGFCVGMTIDNDGRQGHPVISTVGDLILSLRNHPEVAEICRLHRCSAAPGGGSLYYSGRRLDDPAARLPSDAGIDPATLTRGGRAGVETLEYRLAVDHPPPPNSNTATEEAGGAEGTTPSTGSDDGDLGDDFRSALSTVLRQPDPLPALNGVLKVLGNIDRSPDEPKYRKIKRSNPSFQRMVGSHPGAIDVLVACGFVDHVVLEDGIEYVQFQESEESFEKVRDAVRRVVGPIREQLHKAADLQDTGKQGGGRLAAVAIGPAQQSLSIYRRILGPRHVLIGATMGKISQVLYARGEDRDAITLCREAKAMVEDLAGPDQPILGPILAHLAYMLRNDESAKEEMRTLMDRALAVQQPSPTLEVLNVSAGIQMTLGRHDAAITQWEQVLAGFGDDDDDDPSRFVVLGNLARARAESGDEAGAEVDYLAAVRAAERTVGPDHLQVAGVLANLAVVQDGLGKVDEAERNLERSLVIRENTLSFNNQLTQQVFRTLCELLERHKKYVKLSSHLRRCVEHTERAFGHHHPLSAKAAMNAGLVLHRFSNRAGEAIPLLRRAHGIYQAALGPEHAETVMTLVHLGCALRNESPTEAESLLTEAVGTAEFRNYQQCLGPALSTLGGLDVDRGNDYEMAIHRLERGLQINVQEHGNRVWYTEMNRRDLGRAYQATGRPERARNLYAMCLPYFESKLVPTDGRLAGLRRDLMN